MGKDIFGLKAPNLNPNLFYIYIYIYINLNLIISKILSIAFIVVALLLNHINITFQSTSIILNLSESLFTHKGYEYTNVIFREIIHLKFINVIAISM